MTIKDINKVPTTNGKQERKPSKQINSIVIGERDTANQTLGRIQLANGLSKLTNIVCISDLKKIKDGKLYKALKGQQMILADGTFIDNLGTWENYAKACGFSKSSADEAILNLSTFGPEVFDQLNKAGIGIHDMRKLRQLPSDERNLALESEALDTNDRDKFKELIIDLKAKHEKETSTLKEELHASDSMLKASRELSSKNIQELQELKNQLHDKKFSSNKRQDDVHDFLGATLDVNGAIMQKANELRHLLESLKFSDDMEDKTKDICMNALYADTKLAIEALACSWKMIDENIGHLVSANKLSSEYLADLGFEIND